MGVPFQLHDKVDRDMLEEPFSLEELRAVISESVWDKIIGLYGFNLFFYKACWDIVKVDLLRVVEEFYCVSCMPKAITSSFLASIPKVDNPLDLDDFRPIF